ncbi:MAG: MBL fold metallo-hydrolase RNA specificity domain-containing protein [Ruminococcus sp.]
MKITFIGACREVTGSCTLLEAGGQYALVDCGMPQGADVYENVEIPVNPADIGWIFLTHAHVDHSGYIPLIYKQGFRGQIFATAETCSLCNIMLRDCAHIQESEANYKNRKLKRAGRELIEPLFSTEDAERVMSHFRPQHYGEMIQISENIAIRFNDIGHLLGSSAIEVFLAEGDVHKKLLMSGDVGNTNQPIINDPKAVDGCDYLVVESTYGNRLHNQTQENTVELLAEFIQSTLDKGGNLIIPSFAVGRTQELLYFIREIKARGLVKGHDNFPVYVDSPLANEATSIYMQCSTDCFDEEIKEVMRRGENPLVFPGLKTYVTIEESKQLNIDQRPKVIISASGMCEAGRICHHLKYNLWRKECTVLFVGYQAVGTLGRRIYDGAESVRIFGDEIAVNARIATLPGVSGHADKNGLLAWIKSMRVKPKRVFVNHGEEASATEFANTLKEELSLDAMAPFSGTEFDMLTDSFVKVTEGVPVQRKAQAEAEFSKSRLKFKNLNCAVKRLLALAESSEGFPNKELERFTEEVNALYEKYKR